MPRGDGAGPMGLGPMSGRGAGYCAGFNLPGFANPVYGRGYGLRRGRGFRNMYWLTGLPGWARFISAAGPYGADASYADIFDPEAEKKILENRVKMMEEGLEQAKNRLAELTAEPKK